MQTTAAQLTSDGQLAALSYRVATIHASTLKLFQGAMACPCHRTNSTNACGRALACGYAKSPIDRRVDGVVRLPSEEDPKIATGFRSKQCWSERGLAGEEAQLRRPSSNLSPHSRCWCKKDEWYCRLLGKDSARCLMRELVWRLAWNSVQALVSLLDSHR